MYCNRHHIFTVISSKYFLVIILKQIKVFSYEALSYSFCLCTYYFRILVSRSSIESGNIHTNVDSGAGFITTSSSCGSISKDIDTEDEHKYSSSTGLKTNEYKIKLFPYSYRLLHQVCIVTAKEICPVKPINIYQSR